MQEDMLHKAIYNLGSVKQLAKKLGIHREHVYAWIKGISKIPLEYALQIEYLTGGEIHWKDLVPLHIVQRLKHLTLLLPKFDLPPCELVYVSIERIKALKLDSGIDAQANLKPLALAKERPICIDEENILIFGEKTLYAYQYHAKKTIPSWRVSLIDLAKGNYTADLFVKNFFISERVAIGIALGKFLGNRQGFRSDLVGKQKKSLIKSKNSILKIEYKEALMNNYAQVVSEKPSTMRQLIAKRLGFGSHFTYQNAKKIQFYGNDELISRVDQLQLSISKAAGLCKILHDKKNTILLTSQAENSKKKICHKVCKDVNTLSMDSRFFNE